jgi:hypothetical protein
MRLPPGAIALAISLLVSTSVPAQGLFESAGQDSGSADTGKEQTKQLALNGYAKGAFFGGRNGNNDAIVSGSYAQVSLKLDAKKSSIGRMFSEVRLNAGNNRDSSFVPCSVREAWIAVSPGPLDIKLGRQIVSWGRADAINPTNNITPKDETVLSSEFDDTRRGNELLQVKAKLGNSSIQGLWVPCYRPDVLPLSGAEIPAGIAITDPVYPDMRLSNGGYALRLEYTAPSLDGSVSYFDGFATLPGFDYALGPAGLSLIPKAYRMHAAGADFSTTIGSIGVRGEAAVKYPYDGFDKEVYVPAPYAQYVFGLDKSIGNWSALVQYSGLCVINYKTMAEPVLTDPRDSLARLRYASELAAAEIRRLNRLFIGTAEKISHSITGNVHWNTLYETLHLQLAGMYNFTTKEYAINPSASYDIADAISLNVGGRYLTGPKGSLNDMVSRLMSFVYTEVKYSF